MPGTRLRGLVLLLALAGAQLLTVGAALASGTTCPCDGEMCIHHPGMRHAGPHGSHHTAAPAAQPASAHCAHDTSAAPRECSMRGCDQHRDELLPLSPLASLPASPSIALPESAGAPAGWALRSVLDRASALEPPPPRTLPV